MSANAGAHSSSHAHSRSPALTLNGHKEAFSARALELRGFPETGVLGLPVESNKERHVRTQQGEKRKSRERERESNKF